MAYDVGRELNTYLVGAIRSKAPQSRYAAGGGVCGTSDNSSGGTSVTVIPIGGSIGDITSEIEATCPALCTYVWYWCGPAAWNPTDDPAVYAQSYNIMIEAANIDPAMLLGIASGYTLIHP